MAHHEIDIKKENLHLGDLSGKIMTAGGVIAAIGILAMIVLSLITGGEKWAGVLGFAWLLNSTFIISIALGGLLFVFLQHLTRSGWSATVRRLAELTAITLPILGLVLLPVLFFMGSIYEWTHEREEISHYIGIKAAYLTTPFFILRAIIYVAVWSVLARFFYKTSLKQDQTEDWRLTLKMERVSPLATILWALTASFFAFDFIMSLDYHWFSTIFGVYFFAGSFMGFMAFLALVIIFLKKNGRASNVITTEHTHDVGKLLYTFIVFWAYIAFSQYMLIWYANVPEETSWYLRRQTEGWTIYGVILIFGHFLIPFFGLMSRWVKRNDKALAFWAGWMLVMHWIDLYWLIMPELGIGATSGLAFISICGAVGFSALFVTILAHVAKKPSLVALRDPRFQESLAFHNI